MFKFSHVCKCCACMFCVCSWCGSNYDDYGNARFNSEVYMVTGTNTPTFDYGTQNFNDMSNALAAMMQSITMASWTDTLYEVCVTLAHLVGTGY